MSWKSTGSCGEPPRSKKELEIILEKNVPPIREPVEVLEQYETPAVIAADIAWNARSLLNERPVADLGCGTGRLMISALYMGAAYAVGVELDPRLARECIGSLRTTCRWHRGDVVRGDARATPLRRRPDLIVLMNPPFGTRRRGLDRAFIEAAMNVGDIVLVLHYRDRGVELYIERLASRKGFRLLGETRYSMGLRQSLRHHRSRRKTIPASLYLLARERAPSKPPREARSGVVRGEERNGLEREREE